MAAVYLRLSKRRHLIAGRTFNAGYQNHTVKDLAEIVRSVVDEPLKS